MRTHNCDGAAGAGGLWRWRERSSTGSEANHAIVASDHAIVASNHTLIASDHAIAASDAYRNLAVVRRRLGHAVLGDWGIVRGRSGLAV